METKPSGTVSYTTAANNLITAVFGFPDYLSRNNSVIVINILVGYQEGAYKSDGTINTGYIPNWRSLSSADNKKGIA